MKLKFLYLAVYILAISLMVHEDIETFSFECKFIVKLYPQLVYNKFVLLVDGDAAKISASRSIFNAVVIILCLFHATANIKKHFTPFLRNKTKFKTSATSQTNVSSNKLEDQQPAVGYEESEVAETIECMIDELEQLERTEESEGLEQFSDDEEEASTPSNNDEEFRELIMLDSWTGKNWYKIWNILRNSQTVSICNKRLDLLSQFGLEYTAYLRRNLNDWLVACFTWEFTCGMQSTAILEGAFSSMKRTLNYTKLPANKVCLLLV